MTETKLLFRRVIQALVERRSQQAERDIAAYLQRRNIEQPRRL
jgi:hypothetical protein